MVHELQEIIVFPVNVLPFGGRFERFVELPEPEAGLNFTRRARRRSDDSLGMLCDQLSIHARPFTKLPLIRRHRGQVKEVFQSGGILRDHRLVQVSTRGRHVVTLLVGFTPPNALFIKAGVGGHIAFDADNGLDVVRRHGAVESVGSEHVAVVGHSDCRHVLPFYFVHQQVNLGHSVEH